jgi:S-(hydroxymethyl)glutathione dehydrogenase / alcohol dehydrogenase
MKTVAAVMSRANGPMQVKEIELASPGAKECLVKIESTSVCASDVNSWMDDSTPMPCVLGHEGAATIVEVGAEVKGLEIGDEVVLSWIPYCGSCRCCSKGKPHLCSTIVDPLFKGTLFEGATRFSIESEEVFHFSFLSTFSQYSVVPENSCIKLQKNIPADVRALFGCGVATGYGAAVKAADITSDSTVMVLGLGMVGISAIQGAMLQGAKTIIACDAKAVNIDHLRDLPHFSKIHFINVTEDGYVDRINSITNDQGIDVAIDATGNTNATRSAFEMMAVGGEIIVVGAYHQKDLILPAGGFHRKGITVKGSFYGDMDPPNHFDELATHYLNGDLNFDGLLRMGKKLEDLNDIFTSFGDADAPNFGRYIIHPHDESDSVK